LRDRFGEQPFRVSQAVAAGVSRSTLHRLREAGELVAVGRGIVQLPGAGTGMLSGLAVVSARVPRGAICLRSAPAFWDLGDEIPERIHVALPRGAHRPSIAEPATQVHVFDARTFDLEREQQRTDADETFWVYSAERSWSTRCGCRVGWDVTSRCMRFADTWTAATRSLRTWPRSRGRSAGAVSCGPRSRRCSVERPCRRGVQELAG
jgi:hypothetical protein